MSEVETPEHTVETTDKKPLFDDVTQKTQVLTFRIHDEIYGLEIKYILRIDPLGKIAPIPRTPSFIKGIINLRGDIITLIEFSKFANDNKKELANPSHIIIFENDSMNLGLIVEMIYDVIYIPLNDLQENENLTGNLENAFIKTIVHVQDKVLNIVHVEKVFKEIAELDFSHYEGGMDFV